MVRWTVSMNREIRPHCFSLLPGKVGCDIIQSFDLQRVVSSWINAILIRPQSCVMLLEVGGLWTVGTKQPGAVPTSCRYRNGLCGA